MINFQGRNTITVGELIEMLSRLDAALPVLNGGYGMDCLTIKTETLQKAKESPFVLSDCSKHWEQTEKWLAL